MAVQVKRAQVDEATTWNLAHIYATDADWEIDVAWLQSQLDAGAIYPGSPAGSAGTLLAFLHRRDQVLERLEKVLGYAHLSAASDGVPCHDAHHPALYGPFSI